MKKRLLTVFDQFSARLQSAPRRLSFNSDLSFIRWKMQFKAKIMELLDPFPKTVPLNMEVLEEEKITDFEEFGYPPYIQQKIIYDTEKYASVSAFLLKPTGIKYGEKRPAILNAHGHGMGAKKLVGLDLQYWNSDRPPLEASGIQLVKEGYVVLIPDWRPFGDRVLNASFTRPGRDPCNVTHMAFGYFGYNLLTLNVFDAQRSLDLLGELDFVDSNRIGMVGKSYGGTVTAYTTAIDSRIKAACISGYCSTLDDAFSMRGTGNFCGSQYLPGLLEWGDIPDVIGLIAPRPLLIESGKKDQCFIFEDADKAFKKVQTIYAEAKAIDKLERDVADVEHAYIFNKMVPFLKKSL